MIEFEVTKITEHPDGTATIEAEMNEYTMHFLLKIGMLHLFELAAGRVLDGYPDTEGADNGDARGSRDSELFGEIPGL